MKEVIDSTRLPRSFSSSCDHNGYTLTAREWSKTWSKNG